MMLDHLPHDRPLAKRLARDARAAARAQARVELGHAKAVRRRQKAVLRARQEMPVQVTLAAVAGLASLPLDGLLGGLATGVGVVSVLRAYRSLRTLRLAPLPPLPAPVAPPRTAPPPDPRSAAWPAVRRLEVVRAELTRLLPLVAPVGRGAAEQAWNAAAEADAALRWQAARLAAVEPHRGASAELLQPLHDGVLCQERLLAAVADLVAASADPLATARLQDATDALHGLAQGLREVR